MDRQACAIEDAFESLAFEDEVAVDWNDRLAAVGFAAKDVVTAGRAVNDKAKPQENLENIFGARAGKCGLMRQGSRAVQLCSDEDATFLRQGHGRHGR